MLTKLAIRNFKLFKEVEIELGERVVFVGPNNAGKTSALQSLALWSYGVRRWVEKRGAGNVPKERAGVTINRRDLIGLPVPSANLLWRDLHVREGYREANKQKTRNVSIGIAVEGLDNGHSWIADMEFDYANEESFYCRSRLSEDGARKVVPVAASELRLAYLPPMSGLAANESRLDEGAIGVRIGEGRTAEVLRNLCWQAQQRNAAGWARIVERMRELFGVTIDDPEYIKERGEIVMSFRTPQDVRLDLSACGRGQQQTLLLLSHMAANPGAVLLLDEPDAHLEILRQRQIYNILTDTARETHSQIIAATHSEVILNEAAGRDMVVAFVGKPHRIDDRGSQVSKALKEIGFDQYLQAQETGWVLYLEGSTDLAILREFASLLAHPALAALERPFVHYVANQPGQARHHFYGLREAAPKLVGVALYDRLEMPLQEGDPSLTQRMWKRREIENYLCQRETLLNWAQAQGNSQAGELFAGLWSDAMATAIEAVSAALSTLGKPEPWSPDLKVSDDFLQPLFQKFYHNLGLPNVMRKTDYHTLAPYVRAATIDSEVIKVLDEIDRVSRQGLQ